ncbi:AraC family transcriptional regulator [Alkalicoccus chagannorensis]|uniref:AraC family transcriptional regulator n=1 Tax=Alkalicoccus chagannorensis TaxID=427072 RepID=UPI0003FC72DB|nr:AraC family transcriptional regulator [Alkalicoccus chagannorensis]
MILHKQRFTFTRIGGELPLWVESIGLNPQEEAFDRPEGYPYYHWLQTLEGSGTFQIEGRNVQLPAGRGVMMTPYTPHAYYPEGEWATAYVTFSGAAAPAVLEALQLNVSTVYATSEESSVSDTLQQMMHTARKDLDFARPELSTQLYHFLMELQQSIQPAGRQSLSAAARRIRPIVDWLELYYAEDLTLDDIASYAGVSSQYLNRQFKEAFGISPYRFLIQLRIRRAKELLHANPELTIEKAASLTGFRDVSHFIGTFRRVERVTPKAYRDMNRRG